MNRYFLCVLTMALCAVLTACSTTDNQNEERVVTGDVETVYNNAAAALDAGDYDEAVILFQDVEREFPYSEWATRAEIMAAYAYYKDEEYVEAVLALDRFIEVHPGNKDADYAMYLRALTYYDQITDVARDQAMTEDALTSLDALIRRFPNSRYSRDARFKRDLVLDHLAGKEMEIGRYYLTRGHTNAAINRFRVVIQSYQTTTHVPEALHRLVEAYLTLGLTDEATKVAAVLGYNYPGNQWYEDSYRLLDPEERERIVQDRDWMDKTVDSLFKPD